MMNAETASAALYTGGGTALSVSDDSCCSNDMSSAISLSFFSWQTGYITCPGNEVWYKFTTNVTSPHPNGSLGWYAVQTQGSLDTIGTLYDSYGNQIGYNDDADNGLNFKISAQLAYGKTYYIRVKAYHNSIGSFSIKVDYSIDDHGNSQDTATNIGDVYYADKSFSGSLHSRGDIDYYAFTSARNCVMEIYTEGETDTYGRLYCASGSLLYADNNSNGNGNFKITAHLESNTRYYIAVSHNSATGYGDYTLRFKFIKDYEPNYNGNSVSWVNDDPDSRNELGSKLFSIVFLNQNSGYKYHYEMTKSTVRDEINNLFNAGLENALTEHLCTLIGVSSNLILSTGLGLIVQMINNFEGIVAQNMFESALDQVIENGRGFVLMMNHSYINEYLIDQNVTDYGYYDEDYFYGYSQYRGTFYR